MVRCTARILAKMPEYWKRYADRCMNLNTPPPRYVYLKGWVGEDRRQYWLHTHKPIWTEDSQAMNQKDWRRLIQEELIEPIKDWTITIGDRVEVLVGRDKGKHGIVSKIVPERNWVFVEGLNIQYIDRKTAELPLGVEEMPLDVSSEIALVDPVSEKPASKVEWRYTDKGERVRVVFPSGVILNPPKSSEVLPDGVSPYTYIENTEKDTVDKDLEETTYEANLKTFEQDIMVKMGIKETRKRGTTYWY